MKRLILILVNVFVFSGILFSQESKLAIDYFQRGEYEKAAVYYKKLYEKSKNGTDYFIQYYNCLLYDEKYNESLEVIKKHLKKKPEEIYLYVHQGNIYEKLGDENKAKKSYEKALDKISSNKYQIIKLARAFSEVAKYDMALKVYEIGVEKTEDNTSFLLYIGDIYRSQNNYSKMINYYLAYIRQSKGRNSVYSIKSKLSKFVSLNDLDTLKIKLVQNIQDNPDKIGFIDLLSWVYLRLDKYEKARRQIIAIDRRFNENGSRVYQFASDSYKAKKYSTSAKSYQYIIKKKKRNSPYFMNSVKKYLEITSEILVRDTSTTINDYVEIENQYNDFIDQFGIGNQTATLIIELAKLQALNLHKVDKGIKTLNELIKRNYLDNRFRSRAKIVLADLYLLKNEIWESSLLYSQVDKDFKEGELGELARFKNAKLYYYSGDFEWAQIIFDILKPATSRMISNDAIENSVFITETMGEDSIVEPLQMYAKAELLIYQNKYDKAISSLDSINFLFPKNNLEDDIWYLKANIFKDIKKYQLSKKMYEQVLDKYPEELKADNSLFELAMLYEYQFKDLEKAKSLYEKLFIDYNSSTLAVEARKKYRELNGENIQ